MCVYAIYVCRPVCDCTHVVVRGQLGVSIFLFHLVCHCAADPLLAIPQASEILSPLLPISLQEQYDC